MEDTSLQAVLWRFLKKQNLEERTDMHLSVMQIPNGYQLTIGTQDQKVLHFIITMESQSYLTSQELK